MSLPVALQLYSVRDELESDFEGTIKKVGEMGYSGVEFAGLYGKSAREVKRILAENNLEALSAHVPLDELLGDTHRVVSEYREVGCKYIAVPYLTQDRRPGTPGFERTIEDIKRIADVCNACSVRLLYHNHDFEFEKIGDRYALDILYSEIDESRLATEIDTCWVRVAGEDPSEYILKYSGRAPVVHLKDYSVNSAQKPQKLYELIGIEEDARQAQEDAFGFQPLGRGVQDIPSILNAAEKACARWVVVEQDRPSRGDSPMDCARLSREYLKTLGW